MFINDYQYEEYAIAFDCPDGDLPVRIKSAKVTCSKGGLQMIEVSLDVEGGNCPYTERYVEGEYFNKNLSRFFDAFGIEKGNFNFASWTGKSGTAHFEHVPEEYNGKTTIRAKMKYLLVNSSVPSNQTNNSFSGKNTWPQLKGGASSPEQAAEIKRLLASVNNGTPMFTKEEIKSFSEMRTDLTAEELIEMIKTEIQIRKDMKDMEEIF